MDLLMKAMVLYILMYLNTTNEDSIMENSHIEISKNFLLILVTWTDKEKSAILKTLRSGRKLLQLILCVGHHLGAMGSLVGT